MSYTLGPLPKDAPPYLVRELLAVSEGIEQPRSVVRNNISYVEPAKPREGDRVVAKLPWDPGYGEGGYIYLNGKWVPEFGASVADNGIMVPLKGDTESTATGLLRTFYLPYNVQIDEIIADAVSAPVGSSEIFDVKIEGTSILSTKPQIESGEYSSLTGVAAVVSTATFAKGSRVQIYCDQKGSTTAAKGVKVTLVWRKVS